jgi:hypothetical protein
MWKLWILVYLFLVYSTFGKICYYERRVWRYQRGKDTVFIYIIYRFYTLSFIYNIQLLYRLFSISLDKTSRYCGRPPVVYLSFFFFLTLYIFIYHSSITASGIYKRQCIKSVYYIYKDSVFYIYYIYKDRVFYIYYTDFIQICLYYFAR